jgi:hypothetical protein
MPDPILFPAPLRFTLRSIPARHPQKSFPRRHTQRRVDAGGGRCRSQCADGSRASYSQMSIAFLVLLAGMFFLSNPVFAGPPKLGPVVEEDGRRVVTWEMGAAAFVDLQRSEDAGVTGRWRTILSKTSSASFTTTGKDTKVIYRLVNPLVWKTTVVDGNAIVGRFSSLAFSREGNPCISYEGDSPKCLKYAEFDGSKWQISVVDSCKTGTTSLAFSPEGNPTIAYRDETNWDLKYAIRREGGWQTMVIDHEGMVGNEASLAFSPAGNPGISYQGSIKGHLKYAEFREDKWHVTTLDAEGFNGHTSLKFAPPGLPCISYGSGALKYASYDGNRWNLATVDNAWPTGYFTSLAFDKRGAPMIAYWSQLERNPKFAVDDGSGWKVSNIDNSGVSGRSTSLAIGNDGRAAVAFSDDTDLGAPKLKYAIQNGSKWEMSLVDKDIGGGYRISLAFNARGMPSISYYDVDRRRLKFAKLVPLESP